LLDIVNIENSAAIKEIEEMNLVTTKNNAKCESDSEDDELAYDKPKKSKRRKPSNIFK